MKNLINNNNINKIHIVFKYIINVCECILEA